MPGQKKTIDIGLGNCGLNFLTQGVTYQLICIQRKYPVTFCKINAPLLLWSISWPISDVNRGPSFPGKSCCIVGASRVKYQYFVGKSYRTDTSLDLVPFVSGCDNHGERFVLHTVIFHEI
jgi:hypothetical protein